MHLIANINIHTHRPLDFCANYHGFFGDICISNWLIAHNTWTNVLESRSRSRVIRSQWSRSIENIKIHKCIIVFFTSSCGFRVIMENLDIDLQSCSRWNLNMAIDIFCIGMCRNMSPFVRYSRLNLANILKIRTIVVESRSRSQSRTSAMSAIRRGKSYSTNPLILVHFSDSNHLCREIRNSNCQIIWLWPSERFKIKC